MAVRKRSRDQAVGTVPCGDTTEIQQTVNGGGTHMDDPKIEAPPELDRASSRIDSVVITFASAKNPRRIELRRGDGREYSEPKVAEA